MLQETMPNEDRVRWDSRELHSHDMSYHAPRVCCKAEVLMVEKRRAKDEEGSCLGSFDVLLLLQAEKNYVQQLYL